MDDLIKDKSNAYKYLDVTILHKLILEKYFDIDDASLANQDHLVYTRDASDAVNCVKNGDYQCSFLINATNISEIKDISLANEKMPQKSTYFWPKLITGIVINKFD